MEKSTDIRLLDIFLIGPFLIWAGLSDKPPPWAKTWITIIGIGTILYNGATYLESRKLINGKTS